MNCSPPGSSVHRIIPGKNAGVGCHFLLQGTLMTQGWNLHLLHWQADSLPLSPQESPEEYSSFTVIGEIGEKSVWSLDGIYILWFLSFQFGAFLITVYKVKKFHDVTLAGKL